MRVLLVDDETATASSVELMLKAEGYDCSGPEFGKTGFEIGNLGTYDLVIVDLALPDIDGYELVRRLMTALGQAPILILSTMPEPDMRLRGIGISANNYLAKPFKRDALLARIQTIFLRPNGDSRSVIHIGELSANLDNRTVTVAGQPLYLTDKEYELLALLLIRKGTTLTKEMILNHLYGQVDEPLLKVIDVFIFRLRKKLSAISGGQNFIDTIWGRGYIVQDTVGTSDNEVEAVTRISAA